MIDVPIPQSCYYPVRTHYKGTLQPKLGIATNLQDQKLNTTTTVNLSPTQSPEIKILCKFDIASWDQTAITEMGDRDFTNILQD